MENDKNSSPLSVSILILVATATGGKLCADLGGPWLIVGGFLTIVGVLLLLSSRQSWSVGDE